MTTVHLHNIILAGHHGIYDEEKINGNTFEVDLDVIYDDQGGNFDSIGETVDYEALYRIITREMKLARPLLEKVCMAIIDATFEQFRYIKEVSITIYKLQAPIADFKGKAGVTVRKIFDE